MKRTRKIVIGFAILALLLWRMGGYLITVPVMAAYSKYQESVWESKLEVKMPGGLSTLEKDWYPIVMTYVDTGVGRVLGLDTKMLVKYNYGAFRGNRSEFYNADSNYFLSFYGCYIISTNDGEQSLTKSDGTWDLEKLQKIPRYDMDVLILKSIGCEDPDTTYQITSQVEGVDLCGYSGWTRFDAIVNTNSADHTKTAFHRGYFHFGFPPGNGDVDFPRVEIRGRMYAKYFEEAQEYLFFYILGRDEQLLDETDKKIIEQTVIGIQIN